MKLDLRGRRVVVTGAGSGIGRALVREALKEGSRVLAVDKNAETLEDLRREASLLGSEVETLAVDVGDKDRFLAGLEESRSKRGAPQVFINNAGIARVGGFLAGGLEGFESVLRVNWSGVVYGTYWALQSMEAAGEGVIVNMASMAGHTPVPFMAAYTASKYAVVGFTRALREELAMAKSPVKVCLVSPGFVETPIMLQGDYKFPSFLEWMVAKPGAVARAILKGVKEGRSEIYPDAGGRLLKRMLRIAPGWAAKSSRLLLAGSFAQLLGLEPIPPR